MRRNLKCILLFSVAWFGGFLYYFNAPAARQGKVGVNV